MTPKKHLFKYKVMGHRGWIFGFYASMAELEKEVTAREAENKTYGIILEIKLVACVYRFDPSIETI